MKTLGITLKTIRHRGEHCFTESSPHDKERINTSRQAGMLRNYYPEINNPETRDLPIYHALEYRANKESSR